MTDLTIYEGPWLQELFGPDIKFTLEQVSLDTPLEPSDQNVLVLIRPKWSEQIQWIENTRKTTSFKILHMSDEFCQDPCFFYSFPEVKAVMRFYNRPNASLTCEVLTIPLGYHWPANGSAIKSIQDRTYIWSFVGTNWMGRANQLEPLHALEPKRVTFYTEWASKEQLSQPDYLALLQDTMFVPCPRGNNVETYRFYEALENGCIPVFTELPDVLQNSGIPFIACSTWGEVKELIEMFIATPKQMVEYQKSIWTAWTQYKEIMKSMVAEFLVK